MNIAPIGRTREAIRAKREQLSERREARASRRALQRELASYTTPHEVDDLLGVIKDQEGPEAEQIRDILLDNLRPRTELYRAA